MNRHLLILLLVLLLWLGCWVAHAAPGAHGPNGEHLDEPVSSAPMSARPTIEAATESFELVGTLFDDELSVLVDRYTSNEPVTAGTLQVDLGNIRAAATLHADMGDFSFTDPALLEALRAPGEHPLVFTLVTGDGSNRIEGRLTVAAHDDHEDGHDDDHRHASWTGVALSAIAVAAAVALALLAWLRWRGRRAASMKR